MSHKTFPQKPSKYKSAFTLIELSIVLVIIGLIIGGVLVGQDLINSARLRAQVNQMEKFYAATTTFKLKFNQLPGDMRTEIASQLGFDRNSDCFGDVGRADGNGVLTTAWGSAWNIGQAAGEPALYWQDLTHPVAGNISGLPYLRGASTTISCGSFGATTNPAVFIPRASLADNLYIYAYSMNNVNWFGLSAVLQLSQQGVAAVPRGGIKITDAQKIDTKIDDGMPTTGKVRGYALNFLYSGVAPGGQPGTVYENSAAADDTTTCYNTTSNTYSISAASNHGNGLNCALSFRFP